MNKRRMIVAEITKNYKKGLHVSPRFLSERFEEVIEVNLGRGYELHSFKLNQVVVKDIMTETIIAVFELKGVS